MKMKCNWEVFFRKIVDLCLIMIGLVLFYCYFSLLVEAAVTSNNNNTLPCNVYSSPVLIDLVNTNSAGLGLPVCYNSQPAVVSFNSDFIDRGRWKKTRRGRRGGRRKQKSIKVCVSSGVSTVNCADTQRGVNPTNLITVCTHNYVQELPSGLKVLYFNAQSCLEKTLEIHDLILEQNADIVFITETWLKKKGHEPHIKSMLPPGFGIHSSPRPSRGGGVAVIYKLSLTVVVSSLDIDRTTSFEYCVLRITLDKVSFLSICLYRPCPNQKNKLRVSTFYNEFADLLESINSENNVYILGDFNFHFEKTSDASVKKLRVLLDEHNMQQLIDKPTQRCTHTLDLVIVRCEHIPVSNVRVEDVCISDHFLISFELEMNKPKNPKVHIQSRNLKSVDIAKFRTSLSTVLSESDGTVNDFNVRVTGVLDSHAPLRERLISIRPFSPWFNTCVKSAKQDKRKAERQWKKADLTVHKDIYKSSKRNVSRVIFNEKQKYYNDKITRAQSSKEIFEVCNILLGRGNEHEVPNGIPLIDLPHSFNMFFSNKIDKIREELDLTHIPPSFNEYRGTRLTHFQLVSDDYVKEIIATSPKRFCQLDPLPASLFSECIDVLLPYITSIVNESLRSGGFPCEFKEALITPVLKKRNLDINVLNNYRPVSNLPFISKIIERIVCRQIEAHMTQNNLRENLQSAYRKKHSTETALLKVTSDLLKSTDDGNISVLALLDLSAAFDTIDHAILLKRLRCSFGIDETVLQWLTSYISDRQQMVKVKGNISSPLPLKYGVPQGSVLGPLLFSLYTQALSNVIHAHNFNFHFYADDTQLYRSTKMSCFGDMLDKLTTCISSINKWMNANKLKMNNDKTEIMAIGTEPKIRSIGAAEVSLSDQRISLSSNVRDLGVILDSTLSMEQAVSHVRQTCFLELRKIAYVRPFLSENATKTLVTALVTSKLDYCNSLYFSMTEDRFERLQKIQNYAARLIKQIPRRQHITPVLKDLHWLPVKARVEYKCAVFAYQCRNDDSFPSYIKDMISNYTPTRLLRSSTKQLLDEPTVQLRNYGERTFSFAGPDMWNSLPHKLKTAPSLECFKTLLKTHLFVRYYPH